MNIIYSDDHGHLTSEMKDLLNTAADKVLRDELSPILSCDDMKPAEAWEIPVEVSVTLVSAEEIQEINRDMRGVDSVTDVLSFPQYEDKYDIIQALQSAEGEEDSEIGRMDVLLGDVVICWTRVEEQAKEYEHSWERELAYLFVHSMLHLLGYDHMDDGERKIMRRHEEQIMTGIGLPQELKTPVDYRGLYRRASETIGKAYAPYSGFRVGAALMTTSGKIFTGVNVENSSYGCAVCAERTAAVKAVSEGEREFAAIAVASEKGTAEPCGICRQFLSEFSRDMAVVTGDGEDHIKVRALNQLLPDSFALDPLHTVKNNSTLEDGGDK